MLRISTTQNGVEPRAFRSLSWNHPSLSLHAPSTRSLIQPNLRAGSNPSIPKAPHRIDPRSHLARVRTDVDASGGHARRPAVAARLAIGGVLRRVRRAPGGAQERQEPLLRRLRRGVVPPLPPSRTRTWRPPGTTPAPPAPFLSAPRFDNRHACRVATCFQQTDLKLFSLLIWRCVLEPAKIWKYASCFVVRVDDLKLFDCTGIQVRYGSPRWTPTVTEAVERRASFPSGSWFAALHAVAHGERPWGGVPERAHGEEAVSERREPLRRVRATAPLRPRLLFTLLQGKTHQCVYVLGYRSRTLYVLYKHEYRLTWRGRTDWRRWSIWGRASTG